MKIGQVAHDAGVSIDTVRFYERRGVLPEPQRLPSGHRVYPTATVHRIRLAKTLQHLGFTLSDVIDALRAHDAGITSHDAQQWRFDTVAARVDARIGQLQATRQELTTALPDCRAGRCHLAATPEESCDRGHAPRS